MRLGICAHSYSPDREKRQIVAGAGIGDRGSGDQQLAESRSSEQSPGFGASPRSHEAFTATGGAPS
jgi:hypothetical protein